MIHSNFVTKLEYTFASQQPSAAATRQQAANSRQQAVSSRVALTQARTAAAVAVCANHLPAGSNTNTNRKYDVYFDYAWAENGDIEIELPAGYQLENTEQPTQITSAQLCRDNVTIALSRDGKTLKYKRNFFFGNDFLLLFTVNPAILGLAQKGYNAPV